MKNPEEQHESGCQCVDCLDFIAYCNAFEQRWAAHKKANEELAADLAHLLHKDCGPLCPVHGDVRDTSAVR